MKLLKSIWCLPVVCLCIYILGALYGTPQTKPLAMFIWLGLLVAAVTDLVRAMRRKAKYRVGG